MFFLAIGAALLALAPSIELGIGLDVSREMLKVLGKMTRGADGS